MAIGVDKAKSGNVSKPSGFSVERLELSISLLLNKGVLWAAIFMAVGWVWILVSQKSHFGDFSTYESMSLYERLQWALLFRDRGVLISYVGLAILVFLPVLRVAMTGYLFIRNKEKTLALLSLFVLLALVLGVTLGMDHA